MPGVMPTSSDAAEPGSSTARAVLTPRLADASARFHSNHDLEPIPLARTATPDAGAPPVHGIHHYPCLANAVASAAKAPSISLSGRKTPVPLSAACSDQTATASRAVR